MTNFNYINLDVCQLLGRGESHCAGLDYTRTTSWKQER